MTKPTEKSSMDPYGHTPSPRLLGHLIRPDEQGPLFDNQRRLGTDIPSDPYDGAPPKELLFDEPEKPYFATSTVKSRARRAEQNHRHLPLKASRFIATAAGIAVLGVGSHIVGKGSEDVRSDSPVPSVIANYNEDGRGSVHFIPREQATPGQIDEARFRQTHKFDDTGP